VIRGVWGLDTSNYRTSAAIVSLAGETLLNRRILLPVSDGERGLRQSDAVFIHLRQLTAMEEALREAAEQGIIPAAVAVSDRPRDGQDSYMPVFQAGLTAASFLAASLNIPLYRTTHQRGHLAAAARGGPLEAADHYLALHLSGGTTDLLAVRRDSVTRLGGSLDLHAGQLVDRVGVALGLPFPAGPALELLAEAGKSSGRLGVSMEGKDLFCHLSGAESQAQRWIHQKALAREDLAREVYDLLARTTARLIAAGVKETGETGVLVTGGIASSPLFRRLLRRRLEGTRPRLSPVFGDPELSGDNAVGIALIGRGKYLEEHARNAGTVPGFRTGRPDANE